MVIVYFLRISNYGFIYSSTEYQVTACVIIFLLNTDGAYEVLYNPTAFSLYFWTSLDAKFGCIWCAHFIVFQLSFFCTWVIIHLLWVGFCKAFVWSYTMSPMLSPWPWFQYWLDIQAPQQEPCLLSTLKISFANFNTARKNLHEDLDWCIHFRRKWVHIFFFNPLGVWGGQWPSEHFVHPVLAAIDSRESVHFASKWKNFILPCFWQEVHIFSLLPNDLLP